jgi:RecA-family ATPase
MYEGDDDGIFSKGFTGKELMDYVPDTSEYLFGGDWQRIGDDWASRTLSEPDIFSKRGTGLLAGPSLSGKSHESLLMAIMAACGGKWLDGQFIRPLRVLYLDKLINPRFLGKRLLALKKATRRDIPEGFHLHSLYEKDLANLTLRDLARRVKEELNQQFDLLVINPISLFQGARPFSWNIRSKGYFPCVFTSQIRSVADQLDCFVLAVDDAGVEWGGEGHNSVFRDAEREGLDVIFCMDKSRFQFELQAGNRGAAEVPDFRSRSALHLAYGSPVPE